MKTMKKMLAILAVLTMLCGAAAAETLYVATNPEYQPFEYMEDGVAMGFDMDLARALADYLGMDCQIDAMEFDSVISTVAANPEYVGIAAITIKPERLLEVNFTEPYFNNAMTVVTYKDSKVTDEASLKDALIGVQTGTTADFAAEGYTANVQRFSKILDAFVELQGGKLDAVIVDKPVADSILKSMNDENLYTIDGIFAPDQLGIEVNKDNPELLTKLDEALVALKDNGTYDALVLKYFGGADETPAE